VTHGTSTRCLAALPTTAAARTLVPKGGVHVPGFWRSTQDGKRVFMVNPIVRSWRCTALCWSCSGEVPLRAATRGEVERPMHWYCPGCEVAWYAYADRVEASTPALAS
jgi:hypothetical protein